MPEHDTLSAIRFGYGLGRADLPGSAAQILGGLEAKDLVARRYPVASLSACLKASAKFEQARINAKKKRPGADVRMKKASATLNKLAEDGRIFAMARILDSERPFFERLNWFWADHFAVVTKGRTEGALGISFVEEAIRPHVTGRFGDMLRAVVTHPMMLRFLDQASSVGPNSVVGLKKKKRGLNENLARELLELHTLGVGGGYGQADVRSLALLLTGLSLSDDSAFAYLPGLAEPVAQTILGKRYGGASPKLADIYAVLEELALHPDTARHLARKLAVHFVRGTPSADLVAHMAQAYSASEGHLPTVYRAMLEHPAAWEGFGYKVKPPFDYIASSLLALGVTGQDLSAMSDSRRRALISRPMRAMGQTFQSPRGPDGWPEAPDWWITPQGLAPRIAWSVQTAQDLQGQVEDPRAFLTHTLRDAAGPRLTWAVGAADTRALGITLVLASAEFNRR